MPRKATEFSPVIARSKNALSSNEESVRAREYSQAQYGWDAQRRRIMNKHRTRKTRGLDKLEKSPAYVKMSPEEQKVETEKFVKSIAEALEKELDDCLAHWKEKTSGIGLNVSSEEESTDDSDSDEEYEEWHGFDQDVPAQEKPKRETPSRKRKHMDDDMAAGISKIWKKYGKKYQRTVDYYSKIGEIEEGEEDS